jgi:hypothetical protein
MIGHLIKQIKEQKFSKYNFVHDGYNLYLMMYTYKINNLSISFHIQYTKRHTINIFINNANYVINIGIGNRYYYMISNLDRFV